MFSKFKVLDTLLRAEGFFLDVLYGCLGLVSDPKKFSSAVNFFQYLVIKTLVLDRYSA
jgi:hypothetical protein